MPRLSKIGAAALAAFGWSSGTSAVTASYLVVAGGGGGGGYVSGGGGAGGLLTGTTALNSALTYTVTVGAGAAPVASQISGNSGSNSVFSSFTAIGGGGGASGGGTSFAATSGGSGGGGASTSGYTTGASGTSGQGNAGGNSAGPSGNYGSGGGGGSSAVGGNGGTNGGTGGAGTASSISGSSVTYAGGGGGAVGNSSSTAGTGGSGGGGTGGRYDGGGNYLGGTTAGAANTGGGGGGGGVGQPPYPSYTANGGGSGIVIISYAGAQQFGGGVVTSVGGNTIHTFNTSGTLSPITSLSASYLVVAGGGGGGAANTGTNRTRSGGGGGAGGFLSGSGITLDVNSIYTVTVGGGGTGGPDDNTKGGNGSNSVFYSLSSIGGGGGGSSATEGGVAGGSGGGGATTDVGGAGTSGQGNAGASGGPNSGSFYGGGGGGAGGAGSTTSGGSASTSSISGASVSYAQGGNGGTSSGRGSSSSLDGGGGGGGGYNSGSRTGASGNSGTVIISYAGTQQMAGGTVTSVGGNTIHTFTSSGYLTPFTLLNRSLRFRSSASASLSRTFVSGNRKTWTWSAWVKRGLLANRQGLFSAGLISGTFNYQSIHFDSSDKLNFVYYPDTTSTTLITTQVFRDPAAWYHVVVVWDTTQSTDANRAKVYVNGVQVTAFSSATYSAQNTDGFINSTAYNSGIHNLGRFPTSDTAYYDGYMTDINFIDGQALTPSSFGTFNSYGVWQPITYGGSYGTNGFRLPFTNNASTTTLGYDFSPNGNNWTTNNISLTAGSTYDSMTDVPTLTSATAANYAVMNPLEHPTTFVAPTNGNLTQNCNTTAWTLCVPTINISNASGLWQWEFVQTGTANGANAFGVCLSTVSASIAGDPTSRAGCSGVCNATGAFINGSTTGSITYPTTGTTVTCLYDATNRTLQVFENGSSRGTITGLPSGDVRPFVAASSSNGSPTFDMNFGQRPFGYEKGGQALNTYNL